MRVKEILEVNNLGQHTDSVGEARLDIGMEKPEKKLLTYKNDFFVRLNISVKDYKKLKDWPDAGKLLFKKCEVTLESQNKSLGLDNTLGALLVSSYSKNAYLEYSMKKGKIIRKEITTCFVTFTSPIGGERPETISANLTVSAKDLNSDLKKNFKIKFSFS
jgi:hypothetical protein